MKRLLPIIAALCALVSCTHSDPGKLEINDRGYFETQGVNVLVYSNRYQGVFCDEKTAGIEIIQRGVRIATGGGVRLMNTPEQWDIYSTLTERTIDTLGGVINCHFKYQDYEFDYDLKVQEEGIGFRVSVILDKPVPENLVGKAGLNMEFFPATYYGKTYMVDGQSEIFPRYPSSDTEMHPNSDKIPQFWGLSTFDDRGRDEFIVPKPISKGHTIVVAPEDESLRVLFKSDAELNLFDGRNLSQNGTFVVRSFLPGGKTGTVLEWYVEPTPGAGWIREPNVGFSQIGYTPAQKKVAVIELDRNDKVASKARIWRVNADGSSTLVLEPAVKEWGIFYDRYNYAQCDFSAVREPGTYFIEYKDVKTNPFPINVNVYDGKWHNTMDVWLPVQMDHMLVNEAYRVWHGRSHMDDAIQAPTNYQQHDGYRMGNTTNTKYKPYEHIPGLAVGAWYDAGDFDIQSGTVIGLTNQLAEVWDVLRPERDQTFIDQKTQFVDIHRPDGLPDIIQQVEHGALNLCAQIENIGFIAGGIVQGNMHQYHHLGDAVTITDGYIYDPSLKPYEVRGNRSGTLDDRFAFTNNAGNPMGNANVCAALAHAARVLAPYIPETAERCRKNALKLWKEMDEFQARQPQRNQNAVGGNAQWGGQGGGRGFGGDRSGAAIQMWLLTGDDKYKEMFLPMVMRQIEAAKTAPQGVEDNRTGGGSAMRAPRVNITTALQLLPYMDDDFKAQLREVIPVFVEDAKRTAESTPYGVPVAGGTWGGSERVISWAQNNYMVWRYYPDLIDPEMVLDGLSFIYGCHPYSNVSFVTAVGVNTKKVAYGNNRADYTFIPGGIAPGLVLLQPDLLEHKDDYPFLWGENECCTRTVPSYVTLSIGAEEIAAAINK
ncbi:MAG: glycoside hydrolase family 9 protein [Bacteroidaceae bacterium]|nr:glycoside hydrolase family 9 protein [Bacteroidaceae bacterium]